MLSPSQDPVSTVGLEVKQGIRRRISVRHPGHGFLGEETGLSSPENQWIIDPIDGTMNLANGVPIFASTVTVLQGRVPGVTHALRPGVYHARARGGLGFDGDDLRQACNTWGVQRRLNTAPMPAERHTPRWDHRNLAFAASESAYVPAGMLMSVRSESHRSWDVAEGIVLAQAAGHEQWTFSRVRWQPFAGFGDDPESWCQAVLFATPETLVTLQPGL